MQKFRIKCRFCYVLRVFRETAVCEKSEQRSRHAIEGLSRRLLVIANVLNHMCLSVPRTVLETRSLLALCDESSTVLSPCAVLRQSVSCCAVSLPFCVTSD